MFEKLFKKPPPLPPTGRDWPALLASSRRPALHLVAADTSRSSHLGGLPCLPDDVPWPSRSGRPLSFLAQLDLLELQRKQGIPWLPLEGHLLFFYDREEQPWGFDPADRGAWAVMHVMPGAARRAVPEGLSSEFIAAQVDIDFRPIQSYPSAERAEVVALNLNDSELSEYGEVCLAVFDQKPNHQVGGYPNCVQSDRMEEEAQLASNGLYCGDSTGYADPRAESLSEGVHDWRLLLQVDSDDDFGVMWGDCGLLYFWVREQDAKRGDFSNAWTILQCF